MFFVIACAVLLATTGQQWGFAVMGSALSKRVRAMLFRAILRQNIGWVSCGGFCLASVFLRHHGCLPHYEHHAHSHTNIHTHSLMFRWFDQDQHSSGQLSSTLSTDAAAIRGAVGDVCGVVVQNLACMLAG